MEQATLAGKYLKAVQPPIAAIYSSPLQRCVETADRVAAELGIGVIRVEQGLAEVLDREWYYCWRCKDDDPRSSTPAHGAAASALSRAILVSGSHLLRAVDSRHPRLPLSTRLAPQSCFRARSSCGTRCPQGSTLPTSPSSAGRTRPRYLPRETSVGPGAGAGLWHEARLRRPLCPLTLSADNEVRPGEMGGPGAAHERCDAGADAELRPAAERVVLQPRRAHRGPRVRAGASLPQGADVVLHRHLRLPAGCAAAELGLRGVCGCSPPGPAI